MAGFLSPPSPGRITAPWGAPPATPNSPARHLGTDRGWGNGDTIYAMRDGVVAQTAYSGSYGNRTVIAHGEVVPGSTWETWYCHQSEFWVKPGDRVTRGQAIGRQGSTGNVTGKHLHSELRINGASHDQVPWENTPDPSTSQMLAARPAGSRKRMFLDWSESGTGSLTTDDGVLGLPSMQVYNLFYRKINSNQLAHPNPDSVKQWVPGAVAGKPAEFNDAEQAIMNSHLKLLSTQKQTSVIVDPVKLASAVTDALGKTWNPKFDVNPATLAAAFDAATPRVVAAMLAEQSKRLGKAA